MTWLLVMTNVPLYFGRRARTPEPDSSTAWDLGLSRCGGLTASMATTDGATRLTVSWKRSLSLSRSPGAGWPTADGSPRASSIVAAAPPRNEHSTRKTGTAERFMGKTLRAEGKTGYRFAVHVSRNVNIIPA